MQEEEENDNLIYGIHPVKEAILTGKVIDKLLVQTGLKGENATELKRMARKAGVVVKEVPAEKLFRLTPKNHQGFVGFVSPIENGSIEEILPKLIEAGIVPRILILDGITDVRNFGSIVRTAECMGVNAIVLPARNSVPINADVVKTSAGAIFNLPICKEIHFGSTIEFIQSCGVKLVASSEQAKDNIYQTDLTGPIAIIMGDEGEGVHPKTLEKVNHVAKIPMGGKMASLNVAVAAGMILSEVERQQNFK
jgi:23S rRNA (guanosine2251-2'-O)-methyltransferase|tara:strand:+ start:4421 stop:5173 length:753 start_codon:yes stop_codon:yes gene_type:complete